MEKNLKIVYILVIIGLSMIFIGLILKFKEAQRESYCGSLEPMEYFNSDKCRWNNEK